MKNNIFVIVLALLSLELFGQEESKFNLLETDSTWNQEVFQFPINFAPEIKFKGFEDARFPRFWAQKNSTDFWSYVFVWSINNPVELSTALLETNIEMYFNGLMNYKNSVALFTKKEPSANANKYIGKLKTIDALVEKSNMTLNITADYFYCNQFRKTYILFRFSPQDFVHDIWTKLASVTLRKGFCDL